MINNNKVNWDEIPEDVEAVVTFKCGELSYYKVVDGEVRVQCWRGNPYRFSDDQSLQKLKDTYGDRLHLRPTPTTEPPESTQVETLGENKPSISTILQEAQQAILKHHGVNGKVMFTVECS